MVSEVRIREKRRQPTVALIIMFFVCAGPGACCGGAVVDMVSDLSASRSSTRDDQTLSGPQVRQLFAGKTVTGRHLLRGYTFRSYYEPGGTFRSYQGGATEPRHAEWWTQGSLICIKWQDTREQFCRSIVREPDGSYTKVWFRGGERRDIVDFHSFQAGNPQNL